jgi:CheY-like chemotaxis protein
MNAILGFTELLKRGYGEETRDNLNLRHLDTIHSSGRHLLDLINDILDLSKVEAGRLEIEHARFSPQTVIHETLNVLGVRAAEKGISLEFEAAGELPDQIESDPGRLRQIVTNLVGNAIKFTDAGGVTVRASIVETDANKPQYRIDITDTGVGMEPDQLQRIFDPFAQADSSITRKFGGTGLGLSISKRFSEALGGGIEVTSSPGVGSTFSVTVDTGSLVGVRWLSEEEAASTAQVVEVDETDAVWHFPAARVLVVDDGRENRELVRLVLEDVGLEVEEAENGQIGVDKARDGAFQLVLMDVQMPVMDGFTATSTLREAGVQTPIVALTANAMKGFEAELLSGGFTAYLTKPIDIDLLLREVATYLDGYQVLTAAESATPQGATPQGATPQGATDVPAQAHEPAPSVTAGASAPASIASTLTAVSTRFVPVVEKFLRDLDQQMVRLEAAVDTSDWATVGDIGHWLKGAGGTVGFDVLTELATSVESAAQAADTAAVQAAFATLRDTVARLVVSEGQAVTPAPAAQASMQGEAPPTLEPAAELERAPVLSSLAGNAKFQPVIEKFLDTLSGTVEKLEQAFESKDLTALTELAHFTKGAAGTVGFDVFTQPCQALEDAVADANLAAVHESLDEIRALARAARAGTRSFPVAPDGEHEQQRRIGAR